MDGILYTRRALQSKSKGSTLGGLFVDIPRAYMGGEKGSSSKNNAALLESPPNRVLYPG